MVLSWLKKGCFGCTLVWLKKGSFVCLLVWLKRGSIGWLLGSYEGVVLGGY